MREYKKDWKYNDVIPAEDINRWEKNTEEIDNEMQTISGNLLSLAAYTLGESDTVKAGGAFNKNIESMYSVGDKISIVEENFTVKEDGYYTLDIDCEFDTESFCAQVETSILDSEQKIQYINIEGTPSIDKQVRFYATAGSTIQTSFLYLQNYKPTENPAKMTKAQIVVYRVEKYDTGWIDLEIDPEVKVYGGKLQYRIIENEVFLKGQIDVDNNTRIELPDSIRPKSSYRFSESKVVKSAYGGDDLEYVESNLIIIYENGGLSINTTRVGSSLYEGPSTINADGIKYLID